jgi:hypothetical protein
MTDARLVCAKLHRAWRAVRALGLDMATPRFAIEPPAASVA